MDLLDRVATPARDLLRRVDATLSGQGAPGDDPVWPLLRQAGALPGDLVEALLGADPAVLAEPAERLRSAGRQLAIAGDSVPGPAGWHGAAADSFAGAWRGLSARLGEGPESLPGRLADTASYVDEVARWLAGTRRSVAVAVAECLGSAAAVVLRGQAPDPPAGASLLAGAGALAGSADKSRAAAEIGAHVLQVAVEALADGEALHARWAGRLDPLAAPVPQDGEAVRATDQIRLTG